MNQYETVATIITGASMALSNHIGAYGLLNTINPAGLPAHITKLHTLALEYAGLFSNLFSSTLRYQAGERRMDLHFSLESSLEFARVIREVQAA